MGKSVVQKNVQHNRGLNHVPVTMFEVLCIIYLRFNSECSQITRLLYPFMYRSSNHEIVYAHDFNNYEHDNYNI